MSDRDEENSRDGSSTPLSSRDPNESYDENHDEEKSLKRKRSYSVGSNSQESNPSEGIKKSKSISEDNKKNNSSPKAEKPKSDDIKTIPSIVIPQTPPQLTTMTTPANPMYHHMNPSNNPGGAMIISETADTMVMEIPPEKVGQVIGSKGMVIQDVQARSGAKAIVNQDFPPGVNRQVHITGTQAQIRMAAELIKKIVVEGPTAVHVNSMTGGPTITTVVDCPAAHVGKIIGPNGQSIKEIQSKSGAKVQIDQNFPPNVPRKVHITGTTIAVNTAVSLVQGLLSQGTSMGGGGQNMMMGGMNMSGAQQPSPSMSNYATPFSNPYGASMPSNMPPTGMNPQSNPAGASQGQEMSHTMDIPKAIVGRIIGKAGETIQLLQRKSGCRVKVDQQVPDGFPCKVYMTGTPQTIAIATQLVQEIMMGVHTSKIGANLPPVAAAGGGMGMGMNMGMGMGGMQGMPGMGMGQNPMAYGMANPYGMPQGVMGGAYGAAAAMQSMQQQQGQANPFNYGAFPPQMTAYPQQQAYGATAQQQQQATATAAGYAAAAGYGQQVATGYPASTTATNAAAGAKGATNGGGAAAGGSVWSEHKTDDGIPYWYNATTGQSQVKYNTLIM